MSDPLDTLSAQNAISERSLRLEQGLTLHYRHDRPGALAAPAGLSHHLLTFFLTSNSRQVTRIDTCGEHDGQMARGEFYLFPAEMSGQTSWHSEDETFHIMIAPGLLRKTALATDCANPDRLELLPTLKGRDRKIENLVQLMLSELNNGGFAQGLYLESLGSILCIHLLRQYSTVKPIIRQSTGGLAPTKLTHILDYIHGHLDRDLKLATIAQQVDLSQYYFASQFKQSMGMTPHQYVNQQRIEKAKRLLKTKKLSISEIALDCGFSSQSHLTKVFRHYIGTTPKAYRLEVWVHSGAG